MTGRRALEVLAGLAAGKPAFDADEIELLLAHRLAVEADPDDFAMIQRLTPIVREHAGCELGDPLAIANLMHALGELDGKLRRDWYRFTTSDAKLAAQERQRIAIRRALAILNDQVAFDAMRKLQQDALQLAGGRYVACEPLGSELYALTQQGASVLRQLELRIARYGEAPFKHFLEAFDRSAAKMHAFSGEIATIAGGIGHVPKNAHQAVIGLAKAGVPASQAVVTYHAAKRITGVADTAVICARNAEAFGGPDQAARRLQQAQTALRRAKFAANPVVLGAAKTLLPFEPLDSGAARFREIYDLLERGNKNGSSADSVEPIKHTARLMPAHGTPREVVQRMQDALALLRELSGRKDRRNAAVALASMVREGTALPALVTRFIELERELVTQGVSQKQFAEADALECVSCAGTPGEVVATVRALGQAIARDRDPARHNVAIAVAFAKRFTY